ncbi:unnamed protein product [Rotaria sp. Silwood1]|nr:unnamed protein product [Rotaria sp. Silwood1]CAF3694423.1 unnamed protein product [Rotaria sp. Silwood1]CAF4899614.1 unnamed protein product [Rotaria sp. Silwood1]
MHCSSSSKTNNQKQNPSNNSPLILEDNQIDLITSENDLLLSKGNDVDFDRLRSYYILTMTDLVGRYLIHKTFAEFRQFLVEKVQCSQSSTDEIIQLMDT